MRFGFEFDVGRDWDKTCWVTVGHLALLFGDFYFFRPARFARLLYLGLTIVGFLPLVFLWVIALTDPGKARRFDTGTPQPPASELATE